jgi:hypothetical protein
MVPAQIYFATRGLSADPAQTVRTITQWLVIIGYFIGQDCRRSDPKARMVRAIIYLDHTEVTTLRSYLSRSRTFQPPAPTVRDICI